MAKPVQKSFRATLERMESALKWVIVHIPFDVAKAWGARGMVKVKGEINGFAFRTSLFPIRKGGHFLLVNKRMQAGAGAVCGSVANFRLEPDTARRIITIPPELNRLLNQSRALRSWFTRLNDSTRKDISSWITAVKSVEARERRAEQIAERLLATMEAERDLPPILQVAFARDPRARRGWELMSGARRRSQLLAIFYYRSPEGRARRVASVVEEAIALAEKRMNR
jgi:uncharacterized protein YdeI (YjbR/CyaY-like superfamily)